MLRRKELQIAVEDARDRHLALLGLLYEIDRKALSLLSVCVTLGVAAFSGVGVSLQLERFLDVEFSLGLAVLGFGFFISAYFCTRVFIPSDVGLPGKGAEFWLWAIKSKRNDLSEVVRSYLEQTKASTDLNRDLNSKVVKEFRRAKSAFILTPIAGVIAVIVTGAVRHWLDI